MYTNVGPAPDRIFGRIFPCLETIVMAEVVRRFPVVEYLIAVLYWGEGCRNNMGSEEYIEGDNGFDLRGCRLRLSWPGRELLEVFNSLTAQYIYASFGEDSEVDVCRGGIFRLILALDAIVSFSGLWLFMGEDAFRCRAEMMIALALSSIAY
jgi:hypothetical protein